MVHSIRNVLEFVSFVKKFSEHSVELQESLAQLLHDAQSSRRLQPKLSSLPPTLASIITKVEISGFFVNGVNSAFPGQTSHVFLLAWTTSELRRCLVKVGEAAVERESTLLASLKENPAIKRSPLAPEILSRNAIPKYDKFYFVMPLYETVARLDVLTTEQEKELLGVAASVLSFLECLHAAGYIFCDIKPSNLVWRDLNPQLKVVTLIDFGAATKKYERPHEVTQGWFLDCSTAQATEFLDRVCLVTTLLDLFGIPLSWDNVRSLRAFLKTKPLKLHNREARSVVLEMDIFTKVLEMLLNEKCSLTEIFTLLGPHVPFLRFLRNTAPPKSHSSPP